MQRVFRDDPPAMFLAWQERSRALSRAFEAPDEGSVDILGTIRQWRGVPMPDQAREMRGVTARFVMLIATAAVAPLVVYGLVSILRLESGTKQSVTEGNTRVATQAAEQIKQIHREQPARPQVSRRRAPRSRAAGRGSASRILRDYVLDFPEFREIALLDADRRGRW